MKAKGRSGWEPWRGKVHRGGCALEKGPGRGIEGSRGGGGSIGAGEPPGRLKVDRGGCVKRGGAGAGSQGKPERGKVHLSVEFRRRVSWTG